MVMAANLHSLENPPRDKRVTGCFAFAGLLTLGFIKPLYALVIYAAGTDLHSHILLIPFISLYLIWVRRGLLPQEHHSAVGLGLGASTIAVAALAAGGLMRGSLSDNDYLSLIALSFVAFLWAGGFLFLGRRWMVATAFPMSFLIFLAPLPDLVVEWLEHASVLGSAEAAAMFFAIAGTPVFRDGVVFQLSGITLQVAQECSGIRSSLVLFITSLVASYLFLKSPWRRALLVALVIPLGILRNGFRIMVIGLLCIHLGPHMIDSAIHHQGGPLFFTASLFPLALLLWWLRRGERRVRE